MTCKEINDEILDVWKEFDDKVKRFPGLYSNLKDECLLFVGINPSLPSRDSSEKKFNKRLEKIGHNGNYKDFFEWQYPPKEEKRELLKGEREEAKGSSKNNAYKYFKPFYKISDKVNMDWEHVDLFSVRTKNQNNLKNLLEISNNYKEFNNFAKKQIKVFKNLLKEVNPKIIVVENALASHIIKEDFAYIEWSKNKGFHLSKIDGRKVPIFFSGMLSGRRALDTGSRKRLVWNIKRAKELFY